MHKPYLSSPCRAHGGSDRFLSAKRQKTRQTSRGETPQNLIPVCCLRAESRKPGGLSPERRKDSQNLAKGDITEQMHHISPYIGENTAKPGRKNSASVTPFPSPEASCLGGINSSIAGSGGVT